MTWQFTLTGLLIGVLVGLTGMGGGSLMTPILVIVFGFKPTYAVGTDILHGAGLKSFGAERRAVRPPAERQGPRGHPRCRGGIRRRPDVRRERHVLRPRDGDDLSVDDRENRRHGHLPRRCVALGRGIRTSRAGQRRPARDG